jgi:hypothetical protein
MNYAKLAAASLLAVLLLAVSAFQTGNVTATYVAGFEPQFGRSGVPFTGDMQLTFNHGIVSGWYTDTSIRPDSPFRNRFRESVSGGVNGNGNIHFTISVRNPMSFNGTIDQYGSISGSSRQNGRIFAFQAIVRR